jgi:5,6-dimethylbenzimidazole synthase
LWGRKVILSLHYRPEDPKEKGWGTITVSMEKGLVMDLVAAIKERRSCRAFLPDPIDEATIEQVLEAAVWAPSPANLQPWEFIVITGREVKEKIYATSNELKQAWFEKSGWNWVNKYSIDFLKDVPAMVCVVADPKKSGLDFFSAQGVEAYQHACAAAIQNMMLMAHSLSLGTLWFTLFDRDVVRGILGVAAEKDPMALICIGKPAEGPLQTKRKSPKDKTTYLR